MSLVDFRGSETFNFKKLADDILLIVTFKSSSVMF